MKDSITMQGPRGNQKSCGIDTALMLGIHLNINRNSTTLPIASMEVPPTANGVYTFQLGHLQIARQHAWDVWRFSRGSTITNADRDRVDAHYRRAISKSQDEWLNGMDCWLLLTHGLPDLATMQSWYYDCYHCKHIDLKRPQQKCGPSSLGNTLEEAMKSMFGGRVSKCSACHHAEGRRTPTLCEPITRILTLTNPDLIIDGRSVTTSVLASDNRGFVYSCDIATRVQGLVVFDGGHFYTVCLEYDADETVKCAKVYDGERRGEPDESSKADEWSSLEWEGNLKTKRRYAKWRISYAVIQVREKED